MFTPLLQRGELVCSFLEYALGRFGFGNRAGLAHGQFKLYVQLP